MLNKKAVSLIVSYVLLISIGLSIAGLVYGWLRFYSNMEETEKCPDGIHIAIMSASYSNGSRVDGMNLSLNLTIQNRGRFNVTGYIIRINNITGIDLGTERIFDLRPGLSLNENSTTATFPFAPNKEIKHKFNSTHLEQHRNICFVEVQPYLIKSGEILACPQVSTRKINC